MSKIEIRSPLINIPLIDAIFYFKTKKQLFCFNNIWDNQFKMNEIVNENLMTGDKLMSKLHLRQPGFTYSACGSFTRYSENIKKLKKTGHTSYIYKNQLDKPCFAHDASYTNSKDIHKRNVSDQVFKHRSYKLN